MKTIAVIQDDVVVNIIVESDDWVNPDDGTMIEYDDEHPAAIGWLVIDGVIVDPNPPQPPNPVIMP